MDDIRPRPTGKSKAVSAFVVLMMIGSIAFDIWALINPHWYVVAIPDSEVDKIFTFPETLIDATENCAKSK